MPEAPPQEDQVSEPEPELSEPLVVVEAGAQLVALELEQVREVVTARPFADLPGAPGSVRGLVNVRGRAVTVVDLGAALDLAPCADSPGHRVLVVEYRGLQVGVAVTDVVRITRLPVAEQPADPGAGRTAGWLSAAGSLDGRDIGRLDADGLLHSILA